MMRCEWATGTQTVVHPKKTNNIWTLHHSPIVCFSSSPISVYLRMIGLGFFMVRPLQLRQSPTLSFDLFPRLCLQSHAGLRHRAGTGWAKLKHVCCRQYYLSVNCNTSTVLAQLNSIISTKISAKQETWWKSLQWLNTTISYTLLNDWQFYK